MARYITIDNTSPAVPLAEIPDEHYGAVYDDLADRLAQERYHMAHYFAREEGDRLRFYAILLDDSSRKIMITSFAMGYHDEGPLPSLTALRPAMHPFERDITERYGVRFDAMPWDKPLRLPFDRREALLAHAHVASLYPVAETHVSSVEGKAPKRLLVALSPRIAEAARAIPLAIETPEHHYTEGFTRLMRDFYLKI